jgi:hypothetical protein
MEGLSQRLWALSLIAVVRSNSKLQPVLSAKLMSESIIRQGLPKWDRSVVISNLPAVDPLDF